MGRVKDDIMCQLNIMKLQVCFHSCFIVSTIYLCFSLCLYPFIYVTSFCPHLSIPSQPSALTRNHMWLPLPRFPSPFWTSGIWYWFSSVVRARVSIHDIILSSFEKLMVGCRGHNRPTFPFLFRVNITTVSTGVYVLITKHAHFYSHVMMEHDLI